ncbi:MAG: hypothetical protein H6621_00850 [Halobacteriovoraceae bacterium]|nr:hypothetical protein [Halobacteriovoraceae bacterium]MCB9093589.1 hypothetical protein [Halobacteriovoraceae bacterium]
MDKHTQPNPSPIQQYIEIAATGFYPLFFSEWVRNHRLEDLKLNKKAHVQHLRKYFKLLEEHKNIERKKIAISAMDESERNRFVALFMNLVENEILKEKILFH